MNKKLNFLSALFLVFANLSSHAASEWNTQNYDLYPGDFNGDGRTDLLYVAKAPDQGSGIALSDGAQLVAGHQAWNANGFGIPWHSNVYVPVIGDFNWDGRSDIFMHRQTPGDHYLLTANADGTFGGIAQTIANSTGGFVWSADQHRIISVKARNAGSATNPRGHRLFLQASARGGSNAIFDTSPTGLITGSTVSTPWTDGYLGFQWNLRQSIVHSGDFNNDGHGDLLIQAKPDIVLIDFEIPIPVPHYRPQSFGIAYAAIGSGGVMLWDRMRAGVDWSANNSNLVIGDFDGDGRDDIIVQPKRPGANAHFIRTNANTNQPYLDSPAAITFSGAGSATGDAYRILAANVNGSSGERIAGVYLQATNAAGTDLIAHTIPSGGGAVSTSTQSTQLQSSPTPGTAVGAIPGAFSVDPSGAASYDIKIETPPGIAGLDPDLSFSYSSRNGNGLMGVGWTVTGLSAISRCAMTFEPDGFTDGVDLDANDAYCLDGARLKAVVGTNGAVGTEYRTEIESFQKVASVGGTAHDPGSWVVHDKAGLIRYYGSSANSRIELQGKSQAHVWAVRRVEDRYGNYIEYEYDEVASNSSFTPNSIRWGRSGNIVGKVQFNYAPGSRSDETSGYLAGSIVGVTRLLSSIDVLSRASATQAATDATRRVRTYFLNYEVNPNTLLNHVREIVLCDGGDGNSRRCLGSSKFRWQQGTPGLAGEIASTLAATTPNLRPADIDGDGRTDYLFTYGSSDVNERWGYRPSSIHSAGRHYSLPTRGTPWNAIVMDYDSDGLQDIVQSTSYTGGTYEWIPGGVGLNALSRIVATTVSSSAHTKANTGTAVGDFDGDGTQDLVYSHKNFPSSILKLHLNQPGGFASIGSTLPDGRPNYASAQLNGVPVAGKGLGIFNGHAFITVGTPSENERPAIATINFDGDGRDDVLVRTGTGCSRSNPERQAYTWNCNGQRYQVYSYDPQANTLSLVWSHIVDANNPEWWWLKIIDANGDGLSDVAYATASGWELRIGTGSSAQGLKLAWSASSFSGTFRVLDAETRRYSNEVLTVTLDADRMRHAQVLDYDRDGRSDLMFPDSTNNTWVVLRSTAPAGGFAAQGTNTGMPVVSGDRALIVDDRGDGLPDLIYPSGSNYAVRYSRSPATAGVIDRITDGFGAVTQIQYAPLTEQSGSTEILYSGSTAFNDSGTSTSAIAFPYIDIKGPIAVVSQIAQDNGLGNAGESTATVHTGYKYAGLKTHLRGRGLLGFSRVITKNFNTTIVTVREYAQRWPYTGMLTKSEQRHPDVTTVENRVTNLTFFYDRACEHQNTCAPTSVVMPAEVTVAGRPITTIVNTPSSMNWSTGVRSLPFTRTSVETVYPLYDSGGNALKRTITEFLGVNGGTATNPYDDYGNPHYVRVTVDDGAGGDPHVVATANTYSNDTANWCLGRLTETNVTHSKTLGLSGNTGEQTTPRRSTFTYRPAPHCDLDTETIEPGTAYAQVTDHDYDTYGNKVSSKVGGAGIAAADERTATADYTATQGQFAGQIGNALGHAETVTWDARFGVKATVTGPNGLTSTVTTDTFGRVTSETPLQGLGVYRNTSFYWCAYVGCYDSRSVMVITGSSSDGSQVRTEFDRLNRETRTGKLTLDGRWLWTEKHYDPIGREYLASQPYFDANRKCWTFRRFDLLGRVTYQREPYKTSSNSDGECGAAILAATATDADLPGGASGGRVTQIEHDLVDGSLIGARTTAHANDATAKRVALKWANVFGRTRAVQDERAAGACANSTSSSTTCIATHYDHDAQGNLTLVRRSGQIGTGASLTQVTIDTVATFNRRGFKLGMVDPDMGSWSYEYSAFGELTAQTDAKGQRTDLHYDKLGRMDWRAEQGEGTTYWYYDQTAIGGPTAIGKLTQVMGPGQVYEERYVYDDHGRLVTTKRKIDGNWHRIDQTYDAQSRLELLKYPSWNSTTNADTAPADADRIVVRHNYNAYGFLTSTQNAASGTTYWQVNSIDQYGVTQETYGNGVVTRRVFEATTGYLRSVTAGLGSATTVQNMSFELDRNGNLLKRADINLARSEDFAYDEIDRLTSTRRFENATWTGTPVASETMAYDVFGNILTKGASYGSYNYLADTSSASLCNAPANPSAQPHAVRQLVAGSATRTFCYDRNGNITRQLNGQYDTVTWWVSNLARRITKGSNYAEFTYGPDRARYKQVAVQSGVTETTLYVGGLYERATKSGATEHTYYIKGGSGVVAVNKCVGACTVSSATLKYVHRDHLGSIVALSDGAAAVASTDRMSFDPWGKRRANTWAATTPGAQIAPSIYTSFTRRGYTGHEQLDFLGVVHMNGRIYDSEIGRFLSADPFVQFPESTQGLNRYSYVDNNPLTHTDPSGFLKFREILGTFVQGVLTSLYPQAAPLWGAIGGAIAGGTKGAMVGFVTAGFGMGMRGLHVLTQAVVQGVIGGMLSSSLGGQFSDGFIGSFAGSLAGSAMGASGLGQPGTGGAALTIARIMVRAVVGGTISEMSGGSFANGALSAAFMAAVDEGVNSRRLESPGAHGDRGYFGRKQRTIKQEMDSAVSDLYGKPFESLDQAVSAVHDRLLWLSEKYNIEMNVNFYTGTGDAASSYFIGKPVTDFKRGSVVAASPPVGAGNGKWVAIWHTHPGGPEGLVGDFSRPDVETAIGSKSVKALYVSYTAPIGEPSIIRFNAELAREIYDPYRQRGNFSCRLAGTYGMFQPC